MTRAQTIPIIIYHSIADPHDHLVGHLSLPVAQFERQLQYLRRKRFNVVSLASVHAHLREGTPLPPRAVCLTFDDGYLDNWVYAFPLLQKYSMPATIFVATDFVDPLDGSRPTLADVEAGRASAEELEWWGHASWPELRAMRESGLVDIQSHTRSHTWYFTSDRIVDFHHPEDEYFWLYWNARPEEKPHWLTRDYRSPVAWGTPVYEHDQNLLQPRYFEDEELTRCIVDHVEAHGGAQFFRSPGWKERLLALAEEARASGSVGAGRLETREEYWRRVEEELVGSKRILEEQLGTRVDFVCWPCGDYDDDLHRFAIERCGYAASVNCAKTSNVLGDDPTELRRLGFGLGYAGPARDALVFMNFRGTVSYHSGSRIAFPMAPISRRLMLLGDLIG